MFVFSERDLIKALDRVSPAMRTAFAATCAARLIRLLTSATETRDFQKTALAAAIEILGSDLRLGCESDTDWQALLDRVMGLLPDEGAPWQESQNLLEDAVSSVAYAIRTRITGSSQEAAWSARTCYAYFDSVASQDFDRRGVEEPTEEMLLEHPDTQQELKRQRYLLDFVLKETDLETISRRVFDEITDRFPED